MPVAMRTFEVRLLPARRNCGLVEVSLPIDQGTPTTQFRARSTARAIVLASRFANQHGAPCQALINCIDGKKPRGFDAATSQLYFNLDKSEVPVI